MVVEVLECPSQRAGFWVSGIRLDLEWQWKHQRLCTLIFKISHLLSCIIGVDGGEVEFCHQGHHITAQLQMHRDRLTPSNRARRVKPPFELGTHALAAVQRGCRLRGSFRLPIRDPGFEF
jgi:hypothetical protein